MDSFWYIFAGVSWLLSLWYLFGTAVMKEFIEDIFDGDTKSKKDNMIKYSDRDALLKQSRHDYKWSLVSCTILTLMLLGGVICGVV